MSTPLVTDMNKRAISTFLSASRLSGLAVITGVTVLAGCGDPCLDDGLGKAGQNCKLDDAADEVGTADETAGTADETASDTADEDADADATATDTVGTETTSGGGDSWCTDADMDGFGDPNDCTEVPEGQDPPSGSVPESMSNDCDDGDPNTFPGAAELDSPPDACMTDADMDGYGDSMPSSPNTEMGADCDDANANTFPGAAELEGPDACMQDEDDDGYGEQMPPAGVDPGSDCNDADVAIFMCVLWCIDMDTDGFGDPGMCVGVPPGEEPPNNSVNNDGDCVDDNPAIYPGAAEQEPDLCTIDVDDDGYGDDHVMDTYPAADNGTDCLDTNVKAFPGSAEADDGVACMLDEDNDGWGDDEPPAGVTPGRDCDDADMGKIVCVEVAPSCADTDLGIGTQLTAMAWGGDGNYTYLWDNEATLDDPNIADPTATPLAITTYTVTATDGLANVGSDQVTVHINDKAWVLGGMMAECEEIGFLGAPSTHQFSMNGTRTCTTSNSDPTAYVCPTVHESAKITGQMVVTNNAGDDDIMGFVWGWQNADQYYLFQWKQVTQAWYGCTGLAGMSVRLVDRTVPYTVQDFACTADSPNVNILLDPGQITNAGWITNRTYAVELLYDTTQTEITIVDTSNNMQVANFVVMDSTYPNGQFGTYDFSQINACSGPWLSNCL